MGMCRIQWRRAYIQQQAHRKICKKVFQIDNDDIIDRYWIDDKYCSYLNLPKGSIKRLIGRELTWSDDPVELKEEQL